MNECYDLRWLFRVCKRGMPSVLLGSVLAAVPWALFDDTQFTLWILLGSVSYSTALLIMLALSYALGQRRGYIVQDLKLEEWKTPIWGIIAENLLFVGIATVVTWLLRLCIVAGTGDRGSLLLDSVFWWLFLFCTLTLAFFSVDLLKYWHRQTHLGEGR